MASIITRRLRQRLLDNIPPPKIYPKTTDEPESTYPIISIDTNCQRSLCDYTTLQYLDLSKLINPDTTIYYYNSSICKYKDGYRLFYRCGRNRKSVNDRIATCLLTADLQVVPDSNKYVNVFSDWGESQKARHLERNRDILYSYYSEKGDTVLKSYIYKPNEHVEDPRVIEFNNSWFMTYTDGMAVGIAKLDLDTCDVIYSHFLNSPPKQYIADDSDGIEKNWVLCVDKDRLFVLYSETPRIFIEYIDSGKSLDYIDTFQDNYSVRWPHGQIRGGCPPLHYDEGRLIWFFHSSKKLNTHVGNSKVYNIGAYITNSEYPFKLIKILTQPILIGIPAHISSISPILHLKDNVVYPCGAVKVDSETYVISMGINDYKIAHLKVKKNDLTWETFGDKYGDKLDSYQFL